METDYGDSNRCPKCNSRAAYFHYGDDGNGNPILEEWKCVNPNCQHEVIRWFRKKDSFRNLKEKKLVKKVTKEVDV